MRFDSAMALGHVAGSDSAFQAEPAKLHSAPPDIDPWGRPPPHPAPSPIRSIHALYVREWVHQFGKPIFAVARLLRTSGRSAERM